MLPMGTFGPWAPTQPPPPRNPLTTLTDGEQNVARRRGTTKPKLKVRKTRVTDENKHPSGSSGAFASLFRSASYESGYMSATSPRSSNPQEKDQDERPSTSIGAAPSSLQTPQTAPQRKRSGRNRVFTKVLEGLQKRSSGNSTTSASSSSWTPDFFTPRDSFESARSSNAHLPALVLRASISTTAEVESFDLNKGGSIWTAVQIRGEVFDKEDATSFLSRSIDVAVIVDNSKFASAECLENACSQVIHLAKLLQNPDDRIAVFSTVCRHESDSYDSPGGCQLFKLGPPKIQILETELRALLEPTRKAMLFNPSFFDTLVAAHNALESVDEGNDLTTGRSIVVFTPNPAALAEVAQVTPVRTHVICPGLVPFASPLPERFSGWLLNAGIIPMPEAFEERVDRFKAHLQNIDDLISNERSTCSVGEISNLLLYVKAGAGATIEEVIGDMWYRFLHPGQTISLLVKVKVKPIAPASDPFTSLELMLGEVLSELLQIELVHEHSLFPGSDVTTRATCWLLRHNGDSDQHTHQGRVRNERRSSWIRGLLAYQQACTRPHRDALNALEKMLRRNDFRHCHSHVRLLREELTLQLGVAADEYLMTHVERGDDGDSPATIIHRKL